MKAQSILPGTYQAIVVIAILGLTISTTYGGEQATTSASEGGGVGGAASVATQRNATGASGYVADRGLMIVVSESGKTLYGYSARTGRWDRVRMRDADGSPVVPMLGGGGACAVVGKWAYAFSGTVGRWDTVEVTPGVVQVIDDDSCRIVDGSKIYAFSDASGRWAVADVSQDAD